MEVVAPVVTQADAAVLADVVLVIRVNLEGDAVDLVVVVGMVVDSEVVTQ